MSGNKDTTEVVKFITLFRRLRDWVDDDPECVIALAASDESVKRLCDEVYNVATSLSMNVRRRRDIFAVPVDPKFIEAWRNYEERYAHVLAGLWASVILVELGVHLRKGETGRRPSADIQWKNADDEAEEQARDIEAALDFAERGAIDEGREFPEGFAESIEEGISAWDRLKVETGFDLRGIFRRRELIPFVLVPRHVAAQHGSAEKLSLFAHLQQANDAFVFGVPFAAVALMRSIMETVLREHYGVEGDDLNERINNCPSLPRGASKQALHRLRLLANDVLHFNNQSQRLDKDLERELILLLYVLRALIEGVPTWRVR